MNPWPDLRPILKEIPWVIIGDVATRAYMPERATKDLDILVHHQDRDEVLVRLKAVGYSVISRLAVPGFLLYSPEGVEVDVLFGDYPWLSEALTRHLLKAGHPSICHSERSEESRLSNNRFFASLRMTKKDDCTVPP